MRSVTNSRMDVALRQRMVAHCVHYPIIFDTQNRCFELATVPQLSCSPDFWIRRTFFSFSKENFKKKVFKGSRRFATQKEIIKKSQKELSTIPKSSYVRPHFWARRKSGNIVATSMRKDCISERINVTYFFLVFVFFLVFKWKIDSEIFSSHLALLRKIRNKHSVVTWNIWISAISTWQQNTRI